MHEVAREVQPGSPIAVLSGPTFAHEVAAGLPTAVTLAVEDRALGERLVARIARPFFRPYLSDDVAGAEVGGAVKNVLAIACGVVEGRRLGLNARAALISRGFAEMTRFGLAKGARAETLAGLAGLGDLVLTCSSTSSRNFSLGKGIGEGARPGRPARRPQDGRRRRLHRAGAEARRRRARRRHADRRRGLRAARGGGVGGRGGRAAARPAAASRGRLEVPADALILPVAVAGRLLALRAAALLALLRLRRLGHGRALARDRRGL